MSFSIEIQSKSAETLVQLLDNKLGNAVTINCKGALMNSWKINKNGLLEELIDGNQFPADWPNFEKNGFKGGKMSPFSCRLKQGQYHHSGKEYTIQKYYLGEHAIHGILYDAVYTIEEKIITPNEATLILSHHYQGTDAGYPFPYSIQVHWTLFKNNLIQVKTRIQNLGNQIIPIMDGWHPYFKLGGKVDDYCLQFANQGKLQYDNTLIPTGKWVADSQYQEGNPVGTAHLDDCFFLDASKNSIQISNNLWTLWVHPIQNYPYLQIYTPENRTSIAIENLSGIPNCFNNKIGLHYLQPNEIIDFETGYQIL